MIGAIIKTPEIAPITIEIPINIGNGFKQKNGVLDIFCINLGVSINAGM